MIEMVTWTDSGLQMHTDGWSNLDVFVSQAKKWNGVVTTVGTLIYEDENVLVLALSHDKENDAYYGAQLVWKPCVIERTELGAKES